MKAFLVSALALLPLSDAMAQGNIVLNGNFDSPCSLAPAALASNHRRGLHQSS